MAADQIVRIHDIALRFGHLFDTPGLALPGDHALVEKPLEGFAEVDDADIVENEREEAGIEQMEDGVFNAAYVHVDRQPLLAFRPHQGVMVVGRSITQEIPGRPGPLGHRVGFALTCRPAGRTRHVDPIFDRGERRFAGAGRLVSFDFGQRYGQFVLGHGDRAARTAMNDRNRFAPVPLS